MRIDSTKWVNMPKAYEKNQKVEGTEPTRTNRPDEVTISSEARMRFSETPSSRTEKIESLRQAIQDGTYKPDAKKIAERFLNL
ncbi:MULTISPECIES: flagellar biosynthesis anti-sigma factor FlgM [Exiguobacterium]|uniref:Negative regulator of flagellin synthesis n=1 Tax=Exiguobacterium antarcticum TaxID=132920 RepID=A0ABT6QY44_9BACL|nr:MULTISPECIES: flagellar biosynthesis anti-sigma factor FlgM [Exiguobacterium]AFS71404.1 Anti-sigma-28 factor, FlgM [Exiguobacterium antarcticum B7]MCT4779289.1 flagellar biosynthesis anti-sigma factor FlgM [Exiguobacterium soli]MDI3233615.1 flagellar biosynthesis anti-sigma factor FlgM [Exiguobacterium antarcticum]OIN67166.1 flagellar biosynthesis anti-sigma factor FlgM [Exiguobacterium sp. KRL4]